VVDPDLFRSVLGRFASSVTVLGVRDADGQDFGITISAFASLSLTPPMVLACVDLEAEIHPVLMDQDWIGISILRDDQELHSRRFADSGPGQFDEVEIQRGQGGAPLVGGALAHLECQIVARHAAGDHTIFVAAVEQAAAYSGHPLLYFRGGYAQMER
jgi:flavin reductase (DIM6/NTAB) family NADH-FMN oxidoreductase RutF